MHSTNSTVYAKYEQESPSNLPILTEGKITPQMLYHFEKGCQHYFFAKGVSQDKQVLWTKSGLCDPAIRVWVYANNAWLMTLSFNDFMKELRKRALDIDYEADIKREMIRSRYQLANDFQNWADNIIFLNCILQDTNEHFDEKRLLKLLQENLDDLDWRVRASESQVRTDSVRNWVEDVRRLVEAERRYIKRMRQFAEDAYQRSVKRQARRTVKISSRKQRNTRR